MNTRIDRLNAKVTARNRVNAELLSKETFTPGPWKACLNVPAAAIPGHIIKTDDDVESPIASLWVGGGTHGKPRQLANARLIASAPDLLAALEDTVEQLRLYLESVQDGMDDDAESAYQHGAAMIAKAKEEA